MNDKLRPTVVTKHDTSVESGYWQSFYEKNDFTEGSSFCEYIKEYPGIPSVVMDIGCGQGRDSVSFALSGKTVIGLDRSSEGVDHGNKRAASEGVSDRLCFEVCDVSDRYQVLSSVQAARIAADSGPICFYMRFFLHSIPEDVQADLMSALSEASEEGDVIAVEFRTDKDEYQAKAFGVSHYRRYQNAADFSGRLSGEYGWTVKNEEESQGLSIYGGEDPFIYRAVATKS